MEQLAILPYRDFYARDVYAPPIKRPDFYAPDKEGKRKIPKL